MHKCPQNLGAEGITLVTLIHSDSGGPVRVTETHEWKVVVMVVIGVVLCRPHLTGLGLEKTRAGL